MIRKMLLTLCCALMAALSLSAQNDRADAILGTYRAVNGTDEYRARVTQSPDGTFKGQIIWIKNPYNADGTLILDTKNPDKALRSTPCNQIVLFSGLKYDAEKQRWGEAKIYDPKRGIRAHMTAAFDGPKTLKIRGSLLGISETEVWHKE